MSAETLTWLNENSLIGFSEKRGTAWWYRAGQDNHYPGAIPTEHIKKRIFDWTPVEGPLETTIVTDEGVTRIEDKTRKVIIHPRTHAIMGIFSQGYKVHDYNMWLVAELERLAGSGLGMSSAGLLKGGAVGYVQAELPETITTKEGVAFRPFITAATSLDGSLASTYTTGSQVVVCDNTLAANLADRSHQIRIKHSSLSLDDGKREVIRDALGIVYEVADAFIAQVDAQARQPISDKVFRAFAEDLARPVKAGEASKRSQSMTDRKVQELLTLWNHDERVAPWKGSVFGAVQAVNTWQQHVATVKNVSRAERNTLRMVQGKFNEADAATLVRLQRVMATAA